jgi:magnesium chelatase family protein
MDRIDIHMQVPRVEYQKLRDMRQGESSGEVRTRVEAARERQRVRFAGTDIASNADMHPAQIRKYCVLDEACQALMKTAMRQLQLTARAYHRVLKLSRTIADLAGDEAITQVHLAEALQYRPKLEMM